MAPDEEAEASGEAISASNEELLYKPQCSFKFGVERFSEPDIFADWQNKVIFKCYLCRDEVEGIPSSIDHMRFIHGEELQVESHAVCILCPEEFLKLDNLHDHLWDHLREVYTTIPYKPPRNKDSLASNEAHEYDESFEDDDDESLDSQIKLKCDPQEFPIGTDWSSNVLLKCHYCGLETDGFRQGVDHVRDQHWETLTRDKNSPCVVCPKLFGRMDHLKKHVWSHVNRVFPGVPAHFIMTDPKKPKSNPE